MRISAILIAKGCCSTFSDGSAVCRKSAAKQKHNTLGVACKTTRHCMPWCEKTGLTKPMETTTSCNVLT